MNNRQSLHHILETLAEKLKIDVSDFYNPDGGEADINRLLLAIQQLLQLLDQSQVKNEKLHKQLNVTTDLANLGPWEMDFESGRMYLSEQAGKIICQKAAPADIPFETFLDSVHPGDRSIVNSTYLESVQSAKDDCEIEHRILIPGTKEHKYVVEKCKFEKDEQGKVLRSVGIVKDITNRKTLEKLTSDTLKELTYYKYALDKSSIIAITDHKGVITYVNDNFCHISKYSREELLGQDHRIINSRFHPKVFFNQLWQTIGNGQIWKGEIQNKDKFGQLYWVDTTIVPFLNEQGKPYQYLAIRSDISARKRAEEALLNTNDELEKKVMERTTQLSEEIAKVKSNKQLLRKSEAFIKGILNSLSSHIAVLNREGEIIAVNDAWNNFAQQNGDLKLSNAGVGTNYFEVCKRAQIHGDEIAERVLAGLNSVMEKRVKDFQMEYPCHSPEKERWFLLNAMNFENDEPMVVVSHTDISSRKSAEQKIILHANLLSAVEQSVIATDINGHIIFWNQESERIFGWKKDEVLGRNIIEVAATSSSLLLASEILDLLVSGKSWSGEFMAKTKDSNEIPLHVSTSIITNDIGEIIGLIGVSFDRTEQKKTEEKIKFHSELLLAVEQSIIATDFNGNIIYWNKAAERIYGWSESETMGKNIGQILLSDQTREQGEEVLKHLMAGNSWTGELTVQRKDGEHIKIWISHSMIQNPKGEFVGIIGVSIDITDTVKAKSELVQINERYNLVSKATHDSIWELDIASGKVTRHGDGFEILFGYTREQQNSDELNYYQLVHPDDIEQLKASETVSFENKEEYNWEHDYRFRKANGEYAFVHDRGFILRDEQGKAIKMIGATMDMTERVKHSSAIEEQNKKLREIAWIQSHVVRAPLSRMMGIVNVLEGEELNSEEFKTWVGYFVQSSQELDTIIRDISLRADAIDLSE